MKPTPLQSPPKPDLFDRVKIIAVNACCIHRAVTSPHLSESVWS